MTWVDGQSRASDEAVDRPLQARYDQKMTKCGRAADQNVLRFTPAVFSHAGQIHGEFKAFVKEQVWHKLIDFEGEAKSSRIRSVWSRRLSMVIAFKVAKIKMDEALLNAQSTALINV